MLQWYLTHLGQILFKGVNCTEFAPQSYVEVGLSSQLSNEGWSPVVEACRGQFGLDAPQRGHVTQVDLITQVSAQLPLHLGIV